MSKSMQDSKSNYEESWLSLQDDIDDNREENSKYYSLDIERDNEKDELDETNKNGKQEEQEETKPKEKTKSPITSPGSSHKTDSSSSPILSPSKTKSLKYENESYFKSSSASISTMMSANIDSIPVIVKISYFNDQENSMLVETQIYKYEISEIIEKNYCPFFVDFYGVNSCFNCTKFVVNQEKNQRVSRKTNINRELQTLLFLEKTQGFTLHEFLRKNIIPDNANKLGYFNAYIKSFRVSTETEIRSNFSYSIVDITFQLLWVLYCFRQRRIRHNDMHFSNIFIEELPNITEFVFEFESPNKSKRVFRMKSKYMIKVYDFDNACVYGNENVSRNVKLDGPFCEKTGHCNYFSLRGDLFKFLIEFSRYINDCFIINPPDQSNINLIRDFISSIMMVDFNRTPGFFTGARDRDGNRIQPIYMSARIKKLQPMIKNGRLMYMQNLTEEELNSIEVCIEKFLNVKWVNSPFSFVENTHEKTHENIIRIPRKTIPSWNPTTVATQINKVKEYEMRNVVYERKTWIFNDVETYKFNKYFKELFEYEIGYFRESYDKNKEFHSLITEYIQKKNTYITENIIIACRLLSNPIYHQIQSKPFNMDFDESDIEGVYRENKEYRVQSPSREYVIGHMLRFEYHRFINDVNKIIGDIWFTFNGKLPISLPRL